MTAPQVRVATILMTWAGINVNSSLKGRSRIERLLAVSHRCRSGFDDTRADRISLATALGKTTDCLPLACRADAATHWSLYRAIAVPNH